MEIFNTVSQGITKICRLSWLTNSALIYEPKCGGRGCVAGSLPMSTSVHRSPNKLWRSNSIFNLCCFQFYWFFGSFLCTRVAARTCSSSWANLWPKTRGMVITKVCTKRLLTIYGPIIYMALHVMVLMWADPLRGQVGRGLGPGNRYFFGSCEMASSR